jgi:succinylarginine dihydrolase
MSKPSSAELRASEMWVAKNATFSKRNTGDGVVFRVVANVDGKYSREQLVTDPEDNDEAYVWIVGELQTILEEHGKISS